MSVLPFRVPGDGSRLGRGVKRLLTGFSMEVTPRAAEWVEDFRRLLPEGTRVCLAHTEGTTIDTMIATARRLRREGFPVMPHVPARMIRDRAELRTWLERYRAEADVSEALVLGGTHKTPAGQFRSSIQLLETGLFEAAGFTRLHVLGHPEGNRAIDPYGGSARADAALLRKAEYVGSTDASMAILGRVTFDTARILTWDARLRELGIALPVHIAVAGPARLHSLLRHAIASGMGPSFAALEARAADVTALRRWIEPEDMLRGLATGLANRPESLIETVHIVPLGGIAVACEHVKHHAGAENDGAVIDLGQVGLGRIASRSSNGREPARLRWARPATSAGVE